MHIANYQDQGDDDDDDDKGDGGVSCFNICVTRWFRCLHCLHCKKVMGSIPTWGAVGSGGQVLPRVHSAQVGYLLGLSVWSLHVLPVFTRGFLH